jgi:hypothetical protein
MPLTDSRSSPELVARVGLEILNMQLAVGHKACRSVWVWSWWFPRGATFHVFANNTVVSEAVGGKRMTSPPVGVVVGIRARAE